MSKIVKASHGTPGKKPSAPSLKSRRATPTAKGGMVKRRVLSGGGD